MTTFRTQINLFLLVAYLLLAGCATTKIPTLEEKQDCLTSVEGFFHSRDVWAGRRPALILKSDQKKALGGELISYDENGVTFDASRQGPFYDPEKKYYPYKDVKTLIGHKGEVLYGQLPKDATVSWGLQLSLVPRKNRDQKSLKLELKPNEPFGYCLQPGIYFVKEVYFIDKHKNMDKAVDFPDLFIHVEKNTSNYVGDIYLDPLEINQEEEIALPYKIHSRPKDAFNAGFLGGLVGGALYAASISAKGIIGQHSIIVKEDKDFRHKGYNSKNVSLLFKE